MIGMLKQAARGGLAYLQDAMGWISDVRGSGQDTLTDLAMCSNDELDEDWQDTDDHEILSTATERVTARRDRVSHG